MLGTVYSRVGGGEDGGVSPQERAVVGHSSHLHWQKLTLAGTEPMSSMSFHQEQRPRHVFCGSMSNEIR